MSLSRASLRKSMSLSKDAEILVLIDSVSVILDLMIYSVESMWALRHSL
jgi:hypothetical protein